MEVRDISVQMSVAELLQLVFGEDDGKEFYAPAVNDDYELDGFSLDTDNEFVTISLVRR